MSNRIIFSFPFFICLCIATVGFGQEIRFRPVPLCELTEHPEKYSGQLIRVEIELVQPRAPQFHIDQCNRREPIVLQFADSPSVHPKPNFEMVRDGQFNRLVNSIGYLLPRLDYLPGRISAVLEGRFDSVHGKIFGRFGGYGHSNLFQNRFVLYRVVSLEVKEPTKQER